MTAHLRLDLITNLGPVHWFRPRFWVVQLTLLAIPTATTATWLRETGAPLLNWVYDPEIAVMSGPPAAV
jgi:hypothetical protein